MEQERLKQVISILEEKELDAIVVSNGYNMRYLSGFSGATGYLYLSRNKKIVMTDSRYTIQAKEETEGFDIWQLSGKYTDLLAQVISEENAIRIGRGKRFFMFRF